MPIQLPINREQLLDQIRLHRQFVSEQDLVRRLHEAIVHRLPTHYLALFLLSFDEGAERQRLDDLEEALKSGVNTLQFA